MTETPSKQNKAAAVREYQNAHPEAKAVDVAKAVGCDVTYVYLVRSKERRKSPKKAKLVASKGQIVLRHTLSGDDKKIQSLEEDKMTLMKEVMRLTAIVGYLEGRLSGASV